MGVGRGEGNFCARVGRFALLATQVVQLRSRWSCPAYAELCIAGGPHASNGLDEVVQKNIGERRVDSFTAHSGE